MSGTQALPPDPLPADGTYYADGKIKVDVDTGKIMVDSTTGKIVRGRARVAFAGPVYPDPAFDIYLQYRQHDIAAGTSEIVNITLHGQYSDAVIDENIIGAPMTWNFLEGPDEVWDDDERLWYFDKATLDIPAGLDAWKLQIFWPGVAGPAVWAFRMRAEIAGGYWLNTNQLSATIGFTNIEMSLTPF